MAVNKQIKRSKVIIEQTARFRTRVALVRIYKVLLNQCLKTEFIIISTSEADYRYLSRTHPRANHRPMIWVGQLHVRLNIVRRRYGGEMASFSPRKWLRVIVMAGRYPSVARVHLASLSKGVVRVAFLSGLARVLARAQAKVGTLHRLAGG